MRKLLFILILFPFLIKSQGIIVGDTTSSSIFYKNIPDTTLPFLVKNTSSCDIDIDMDSNNDIKFSYTYGSSPSHYSISRNVQALSNIQFAYISNSAYADTFPVGDTINNALNWKSAGIGLYYYYSGPPHPWGPGTYSVGVFNSLNCYLGFRKIVSNDTIYGWFLCDMNSTIKIKSFAFEKRGSGIGIRKFENNNSFSMYPNPSAGKVSLVFENGYLPKNRKGVICDSNGRAVIEFEINSAEASSVINTDTLPNGVYIVKIQDHERWFVKRLVVAK